MRLIDADAYEYPGDLIHMPTINAVPFKVLAGVCKHGHVACVDSDNRVYDRVCRKNNPNSWDTCSPETCPLIDGKEDAPCG